jgi:HlyD family secretion protein
MRKMKKRTKRLLIGGGLVVVVAVLAIVTLSGSDEKQTVVQADLVVQDDISELVTASGRIQPQTKVDIVAEVSAQVHAIFVKEGDWVERGTPLLLLDTIQLKTDVQQARFSYDETTARTEAAKAQYEKDKLEYDRQKALHAQNLTSETAYNEATYTYENSRANHEAMLAQVKTAQARLDKAQDNLRKTRIVAPMAGVVTYLNVEVGEISQAQTSFTQGKTLMTIADLSIFEVEVDVDETEVAQIDLEQKSKIRVDAFRDTTFEGRVVEIGNSALIIGEGTENYTTSFRVKVRFVEAHPGIRPGMSATVDVTTATADDALLVPYASVVTREIDPDSANLKQTDAPESTILAAAHAEETQSDTTAEGATQDGKKKKKVKKSGVFVVRDGKAHFVEIQTGIADERNIVALSGLAPGDTVVSGSFQTLRKLAEGDMVKIEQSSLDNMKDDG